MEEHHLQLYVIGLLFLAALSGVVFSGTDAFHLSSENVAGAATTSISETRTAQSDVTSFTDEELLYLLSQEREKPLLILTPYEYEALPEEVIVSHDVYITKN